MKTLSFKRTIFLALLVPCFIFAFLLHAFAQPLDNTTKLRLAQNFEDANEWERAAVLYEDLFKANPESPVFLDGLQRCYTQLKEYEKAITIIRRWLVIHPRTINLLTTLGGLYYDSGNEAAADSVWKSALALEPQNVQFYRIVANEMKQHRLYERCIQTYLEGRAIGHSDVLFADELGSLYAALQQYHSSIHEYLRLVKNNSAQVSFVQSRLGPIVARPEALKTISDAVESEIGTSEEKIGVHRLYAWLLMEERRYDAAFAQYRIIDRLSKAHGNELYTFAERLIQEHASETAVHAYEEIIRDYDNKNLLPFARLGYARALEEFSIQSDSIAPQTHGSFQKAMTMYESLAGAEEYPDLAAQALFRLGTMKFEWLFDLDGAFRAFTKIKEFPMRSNIHFDAGMKIGEVFIARNDLAAARAEFEKISRVPPKIYQDQAQFRIAELFYFETKFDTCLSLLKRFTVSLNTDLSNDALQLQYFIQENKSSSLPALNAYVSADLCMRQRKYAESLQRFSAILTQFPHAPLIDDTQMKIGALCIRLNKPEEALAAFRSVTDSIQISILKDKAQFRIAEICEHILHNPARALEAYQKLLEQFPNSLYAEQTRKRIRLLRGDSM